MCDEEHANSKNVLYVEHLRLGATFADGIVERYPEEPHVEDAYKGQNLAFLCDLSEAQTLVFSGDDAPSFAEAAFAGAKLKAGACSFEAVLTGDGGVASLPLLCRTGAHEYVCVDLSLRAPVLHAWLSFLANVSSNGYAPYARMSITDASSTHVLLGFGGDGARSVLEDYVPKDSLPQIGQVRSCGLDGRIHAIVACVAVGEMECFILFVAPHQAGVLWRSLLSFQQVAPLGRSAWNSLFEATTNWYAFLRTTDALRLGGNMLVRAGLVRTTKDFVGARALRDEEGE